jgi:hypothetical protein
MTHRTRRLLAAAAMLAAAAPIAALGLPEAAQAGSLDVFALHGSGAGVRVTVQTGYSFVVEPDAMLPRAEAVIEADTVHALASPLDPGDSVDALPGLGVPTAEQDIQQGASPCPCAPLVGAGISTFAALFNPVLTVPYEHAEATYPDPAEPGTRHAAFPRGSADSVPPDFPDLFGVVSAHSSTGSVTAGPGTGTADAGVGSAVSVPALGLRIGRISSHVDVHGDSSASVSTVTTTLHDVDLGTPSIPGVSVPPPPTGTSLLHIGTMVLTATTQRSASAPKATSHTDLEATGVTVAGVAARLDQNGLSVQGSPSPLNAVAQQVIGALNSPECTPAAPVPVPQVGTTTSVPQLRIGPPTLSDRLSHNGNEDTVAMTGPTLCIASSAPIPGTDGHVAATPTVYTITLGNVSSSAYGVSIPSDASSTDLSPVLPDTGAALSVGAPGVDTSAVTGGASASNPGGNPAAAAPSHPGGRGLFATLTGGILSRRVVVTVAVLAELALLGTLWTSWLPARSARRRGGDDSPTTRMDLV